MAYSDDLHLDSRNSQKPGKERLFKFVGGRDRSDMADQREISEDDIHRKEDAEDKPLKDVEANPEVDPGYVKELLRQLDA